MNSQQVIKWMIGKYDNILQATGDAKRGKPTAALGGHEHVTSSFQLYPLTNDSIVASFTFANDSKKTFRFRMYKFDDYFLSKTSSSRISQKVVRMKIYRPLPQTELQLKENDYNISRYLPPPTLEFYEEMSGCDVIWELNKFKYFLLRISRIIPWLRLKFVYYRGRLMNGECEICSTSKPDVKLIVKDDLKLWENRIWINDQVYNRQGERIIGNTKGIPYKFDKIAS